MTYLHGIDRVESADGLLAGKRVGLITNLTGLNSRFRRSVEVLRERYDLVRLFAPEHGLYGAVQDGVAIDNQIDEESGLPVYSMYHTALSEEELYEGIEVMCFDIQDIGARFYTYISTLARSMKVCAERGIPMVVFDRCNPLGLAKAEGTLLDETFASGVGMYELPSRHGMTVGEYARYINEEKGIGCALAVIPCAGLKRSDTWRQIQYPWVPPSPNIPTYESALVYIGTVLFEATNVSEGRGTTCPFELIGAPWIDGFRLAEEMNAKGLAGVHFRATSFVPKFSKYQEQCCGGVQIHVTDEAAFEPFYCGLLLLETIRQNYTEFAFNKRLPRLLGTDALLREAFDLEPFAEEHRQKIEAFRERTKKYWLYEEDEP
ncbi:MAG: DUF1343 domain-containing protein [Clostridia bacterium]|nr:DUF1343 domain-containing protein [Clostridia bacterium]